MRIIRGKIKGLGVSRGLRGTMALIAHMVTCQFFILTFLHSFIFVSCSEEQDVTPGGGTEAGVPVQLAGYIPEFEDSPSGSPSAVREWNLNLAGTRAEPTWMPEGYTLMENPQSIGIFLSQDSPSVTTDKRRIWYHTTEGKWYMSGKEIPEGDFLMYGYLPYNAAEVSITPQASEYQVGATLTFNQMSSVTTRDICVITGASHGTGSDTPVSLQAGKFGCHLNSGGTGHENYLFLLCEHLYARVDFNFRVDNTYESNYYASLRSIKLRKLEITGYTYPLADPTDVSVMKSTGSISLTLTANNTGASPVSGGDILFTMDSGAEDMSPVLLFEGEKELPSETYSTQTGYIPYFNLSDDTGVYYILRSTYDVYDRKGNLIRKACVAENMIEPTEIFNSTQLKRGWKYTIQLKLKPTYLYVLSDPDLDNPSVEI